MREGGIAVSPGPCGTVLEDLTLSEVAAQVRGFYPDDKYSGSFETVAALVYRRRDKRSLIEFVKRLAFNILIGNGDAHLKNWSLLYENPRTPRLSPAYDLVSTGIYSPSTQPENLGMRFGGSRRFESVSLGTFTRLQKKLDVDDPPFSDVVSDLAHEVDAAWSVAEEILKDHRDMAQAIRQTIDHRLKTLLRSPTSSS